MFSLKFSGDHTLNLFYLFQTRKYSLRPRSKLCFRHPKKLNYKKERFINHNPCSSWCSVVLQSGPKYSTLLQINMTLLQFGLFYMKTAPKQGNLNPFSLTAVQVHWYNIFITCTEKWTSEKLWFFFNFSPKAWLLLKFCFKLFQLLPTATKSALPVNLRLKLNLMEETIEGNSSWQVAF